MFYCPNCNNAFNITRSVDEKQQTGGNNTSSSPSTSLSLTDSSSSNTQTSTQTSTQSKTQSKTQSNTQSEYNTLIEKILAHKAKSSDVAKLDFNMFIKSKEYVILNNKDKEYVYNIIQDLLPEDNKKITEYKNNAGDIDNKAFFICVNCGHARKIENGTLIFTRKSENITQSYNVGDYTDLKYSNILPRTRNYICVNSSCESHKDNNKKEAIFFRIGGYNIKHLCVTCETIF